MAEAEEKAVARLAAEAIAKGSQSFAAAARLFDPETRRDAMMLYAWCRHCDDVVDGQMLGHGAATDGEDAAARLADLERDTRSAFANEPVSHPAFRALGFVAARRGIPLGLALEHVDGFRMDVEGRTYETVPDLLDYCHHVAGVVGTMMAQIMGAGDPGVLERAADLGLAFQLTNIARDIVPDAEVGRIYVPAVWLREEGLPAGGIGDGANRGKVAALARRLVDLAEPYYASARIGIDALPRRSAWAVATALEVYRAIGLKVVERGPAAWDERVSTSGPEKLAFVAKGAAAALRRRAAAPHRRPPDLWSHPA